MVGKIKTRGKMEQKFDKAYFWGNPPPIRNSIPVRVINNLQGVGKGDSVEGGGRNKEGKRMVAVIYLSDESIHGLNLLRCESAKKSPLSQPATLQPTKARIPYFFLKSYYIIEALCSA